MTHGEVEAQLERFKDALRRAGVRQTHQRVEIFREVLSSEDHPDVEGIYKRVKKRLHEVSLDTVYRTLWMANELGLLSTVGPGESKLRFDANPRPHHHFLCTRCGVLLDFESREFDELAVPKAIAGLGRVESKRVEVRGVCLDCAGERGTEA